MAVFKNNEKIIVWLIILGVIFLTTIPYLVGWLERGPDHYIAGNYTNLGDFGVYTSYIEQARQGNIFFRNLFTSEPQQNIFFAPLWLGLGVIGRFLPIKNELLFHLTRVSAGIGFLYFLYFYFLRLFFREARGKLVAFLVICFSSGLGVFLSSNNSTSSIETTKNLGIDLSMPEAVTFLTMAHSALFILSQLLIVVIFYLFLRTGRKYGLLFALSLLLGFLHTYDILIVSLTCGFYFMYVWASNKIKHLPTGQKVKEDFYKLVFVGLGFLPALLYFKFTLMANPGMRGWILQNITPMPAFDKVIIGYGLLGVFAIWTICRQRRQLKDKPILIFLILWIALDLILAYLPFFTFSRKLINGLHLPIAILASYSILELVNVIAKTLKNSYYKTLLAISWLVFLAASNVFFLKTQIGDLKIFRQSFYFSQSSYQAALWMGKNISDHQAILAHQYNGNVLASLIGHPVYAGHSHQTINYQAKVEALNNWFSLNKKNALAKKDFLVNNNIGYVFYSAREKKLGDYNPAGADFLQEVYNNGSVIIYQLK